MDSRVKITHTIGDWLVIVNTLRNHSEPRRLFGRVIVNSLSDHLYVKITNKSDSVGIQLNPDYVKIVRCAESVAGHLLTAAA